MPVNATDEELKKRLLAGQPGPFNFKGLLDLDNTQLTELPEGISCYDLSARNSKLTKLPDDIQVTSRLVLDHSTNFSTLPQGLKTGSLSLARCNALYALPEGLDVWFLNLENCSRFQQWPDNGNIHHGTTNLRNCTEINTLPGWLTNIANLNVAGCVQLTQVPDGITVFGWIDVGGSGLTELPPSLDNTSVHWRDVPVSRKIAFHPESITAKDTLATDNAEMRRVMIERMGYLEFATDAGAMVLDQDTDTGGERQLLKIDLEDDEPLVGLSCSCPSTGRRYLLRVPPDTVSCHQAAAWIAGFDDPELYRPLIET